MLNKNISALELEIYPYRSRIILILIILAASILRIIYFSGLVFSDDSYYNQLAYSLLNGNYAEGYLGYPIFLLRKAHTVLTSFSFLIFGANEFSSVLIPFIFSVSGIFLTYKFVFLYTKNDQTSLIAAFLIALLPTDVIFSTINFADLQAAFLMNFGLYFQIKSINKKALKYSLFAGLLFFLSALFKPVAVNLILLILIYSVYKFLKEKKIYSEIYSSVGIFVFLFIVEALAYAIIDGDIFYRFNVMSQNFIFAYYDFFPNNLSEPPGTFWQYITAIIEQIFFYNSKHLFFRRFYLFIPFGALIISIYFLLKNEHKKIIYWFIGLCIMLMAFTTSLSAYIPMNLKSSWYMFPIFLPAIFLISLLISKFRWKYLAPILIIYSLGSMVMINSYKEFFDSENINGLKNFLTAHSSQLIYTDHHTKYGVDLIDEYKQPLRTKIIDEKFNIEITKKDDLIIFNRYVIEELKLQKYKFPEFSFLNSDQFTKIGTFGKFLVFRKN